MNKEIYPYHSIDEDYMYLFLSEGARGEIQKVVLIVQLPDDPDDCFNPQYNLGFGDLTNLNNEWTVNDGIRSGNGDMPKVIATVARIGMDFLKQHPEATLSFRGYVDPKSALHGRNHRNILYQRAIKSNWDELSMRYNFWGIKDDQVEQYVPDREYDRILIKCK